MTKELRKMGTVEPIYKDSDKKDYEKIGFVRGFITKYRNDNLGQEAIFDYLRILVK